MSEPSIDDLLVSEFRTALENLGGRPDDDLRSVWQTIRAIMCWHPPVELKAIIGSYGDTLSEEEVLHLLKDWNATGKVIHERQ